MHMYFLSRTGAICPVMLLITLLIHAYLFRIFSKNFPSLACVIAWDILTENLEYTLNLNYEILINNVLKNKREAGSSCFTC